MSLRNTTPGPRPPSAILGGPTRRDALSRALLGTVVWPTALLVAAIAVSHYGVIGISCALPPIYVAWVWMIDVFTLVRFASSPVARYASRPGYIVGIAMSAIVALAWIVWLVWMTNAS